MFLDDKRLEVNTKNGFHLAIGRQGSGKTALITTLAINEYRKTRRLVLSNYNIKIPHLKISLISILELIKSKELIEVVKMDDEGTFYNIADEYEKIVGKRPLENNDYLHGSIILLDEIHLYFDAYDFLTKENRLISGFASQLRKRNTLLLATTQYFLKITSRLRKEVRYVYDIQRLRNGLFEADISEIDGDFWEYKHTSLMDLSEYFRFYDTNELILI